MIKNITKVFSFFLIYLFFANQVLADNSFVTIVNPIRGMDYWDSQSQKPQTAILGQIDILRKYNFVATWLIRYDVLENEDVTDPLRQVAGDEKGLFLEITPSWTQAAKVEYNKGPSWHSAGSAFLTGYERQERIKLIDTAFAKFKEVFGFYPKSVGAWWIDSYSLDYMQTRYGISSALIVSDQYTTDNYQIWGQYWSTPYYPSKKDALNPANAVEDKLPIVVMQWAARDPVNGYGNGVFDSTFSVQANDYTDYHKLDTAYFSKLVDIYTTQSLDQFGQLTVGLENSYSWSKYKNEYQNQIQILAEKSKKRQFQVTTMEKFASWYKDNFPSFSPPQIIVASDPLGSSKKSIWFMNPYYRIGWFYDPAEGSIIRDIRQYIQGEEEICYQKSCDDLNFATFATRVLDDVTYHTKWVVDEGSIKNFQVKKDKEDFVISYESSSGKQKEIKFLTRDIEVNGKVSSIDGAILDAINKNAQNDITQKTEGAWSGKMNFSLLSQLTGFLVFVVFLFFSIFIPGFILTERLDGKDDKGKNIFLAVTVGVVFFTVSFYLLSILRLRMLIFVYPVLGIIYFILQRKSMLQYLGKFVKIEKKILPVFFVTILGTIFQVVPVFKSGLRYDFGIGFWGPNTHDGVWHLALINQLLKNIPPQNPVFAQEILKNYHYFYDLLIAATNYLTRINISDLVFRFYPLLFSLLLGVGSYYLCGLIVKNEKINKYWASAASLFLVYFGGSLGWIVEYIKSKSFGGESAFWANQAISFNLNPPFAVSLVILIGVMLILSKEKVNNISVVVLAFLTGTLVGFKAYAGVIAIASLLLVGVTDLVLRRHIKLLFASIVAIIITGIYLLANTSFTTTTIFNFSPFWFIHAMIDSPDRLGWERLSLARYVSLENKEWPKFFVAETLGLVIFILGNLNIRIIGLFKVFDFRQMKKQNWLLFTLAMSLICLLVPIFFIQSGTAWNTIQFLYYIIFISALFSGPVLAKLISKKSIILGSPIILLFFLAPINSITTAKGYFSSFPHARISKEEISALEFLSKEKEGTVLTYPYDKNLKSEIFEPWPIYVYDTTAYVSAFSKKPVFVEDESQNSILLTGYKKRLISEKEFFSNPSDDFLFRNKIQYIYLSKLTGIFLDESKLSVVKIFDNNDVVIYKVVL